MLIPYLRGGPRGTGSQETGRCQSASEGREEGQEQGQAPAGEGTSPGPALWFRREMEVGSSLESPQSRSSEPYLGSECPTRAPETEGFIPVTLSGFSGVSRLLTFTGGAAPGQHSVRCVRCAGPVHVWVQCGGGFGDCGC